MKKIILLGVILIFQSCSKNDVQCSGREQVKIIKNLLMEEQLEKKTMNGVDPSFIESFLKLNTHLELVRVAATYPEINKCDCKAQLKFKPTNVQVRKLTELGRQKGEPNAFQNLLKELPVLNINYSVQRTESGDLFVEVEEVGENIDDVVNTFYTWSSELDLKKKRHGFVPNRETEYEYMLDKGRAHFKVNSQGELEGELTTFGDSTYWSGHFSAKPEEGVYAGKLYATLYDSKDRREDYSSENFQLQVDEKFFIYTPVEEEINWKKSGPNFNFDSKSYKLWRYEVKVINGIATLVPKDVEWSELKGL